MPAPESADGQTGPVVPAPTKEYSYGTSEATILFLPAQIERMKEAIRVYEDTAKDKPPPTFVAADPIATAKKVVVEPASYPVFYLSTIVYQNPGDWSLWLSGFKITSRKNDTDVQVVSVGKDSVTFTWTPTYSEAVGRRVSEDLFAPTDPLKNKLAKTQNVRFDERTGAVTFSLNQNQAFAVGYFSTFEGYVESPKLEPLPVNSIDITSRPPPAGTNGTAPGVNVPKNDPMVPNINLPSTPTVFIPQPARKQQGQSAPPVSPQAQPSSQPPVPPQMQPRPQPPTTPQLPIPPQPMMK